MSAELAGLEKPKPHVQRRNAGSGHWYLIDGKKADGVTTLIGNGMRKAALENWAANETAGYAVDHWDELAELSPSKRLTTLQKARYQVRDEAARRGTEVHRLAEELLHGREVDVPEELTGHVDSAVKFMDDWKIEPIATEASVYHVQGNYAGTLDLLFRSPLFPGRTFLADWKTNRSGIFGETALQLEAYGHADAYLGDDGIEHKMADLNVTDHVAVWIRADGYSVYQMQHDDLVWRTFMYVAEVARRCGMKDSPMKDFKGDAMYVPGGVA